MSSNGSSSGTVPHNDISNTGESNTSHNEAARPGNEDVHGHQTDLQDIEKSFEEDVIDLHPIEVAAHTLLSSSLDNLNENFEQLNQSQIILLTRLKIIEDRLLSFKKVVMDDQKIVDDKELANHFNRVKELQRRLGSTKKTLSKVQSRVDKMNEKLEIAQQKQSR
ncbi:uncharacterized protein RJT20DRAFT_127015 [Scheffersomyces xylosifermentans]|uniref:uncharacterized protein n=1 Tax=Scheffersomyces xylosifermentans TaxID=1304137 RepID=UPI00315D3CBE